PVRAEPPKARRSMGTTTWRAAPRLRATRRAASTSTACRWPYWKVKAQGSKPSPRAMARAVAESMPPLTRTTAFGLSATSSSSGCGGPAQAPHWQLDRQGPNDDGLIRAAGGRQPAVWRDGHACHMVGVAAEGGQLAPSLQRPGPLRPRQLPQPHGPLV